MLSARHGPEVCDLCHIFTRSASQKTEARAAILRQKPMRVRKSRANVRKSHTRGNLALMCENLAQMREFSARAQMCEIPAHAQFSCQAKPSQAKPSQECTDIICFSTGEMYLWQSGHRKHRQTLESMRLRDRICRENDVHSVARETLGTYHSVCGRLSIKGRCDRSSKCCPY